MIAIACGIALLLPLQVPPPDLDIQPAAELRREWQTIQDKEAAELERLAAKLSGAGNTAVAEAVQAKMAPRSANRENTTRFVVLPKLVSTEPTGLANIPTKPAPAESWKRELRTIQIESSTALFKLAERAVQSTPKHFALADACLRAVLHRQPDHPEARRLLGYVPHEGGWATPYVQKRIRDGMVEHPIFGWVDAAWVPHLERGELPAPSSGAGKKETRWLPAEEADRLRSPWKNAWTISTEHFTIRTNVPLSEAIAFGRQLEAFHDLFFSILADLIESDHRLPLAQRFHNKTQVGEKKTDPHQVYYFKDKQEYVDYLLPYEPQIAQSLGIYIPPSRGKKRAPAYFFRDPDGQIDATATLFHEVSHQLLFETAGPNGYDRNLGNYWVFEGLGTYFETVVEKPDGVMEVGGLVGPRIEAARAKLKAGEFVPVEQLVRMPKAAFNDPDAIYLHYAESMALTVFLMQAGDQAYREPFLDYVRSAYRGQLRRDTGRSLESRLGIPYRELDKEFRAFLSRAEPPL